MRKMFIEVNRKTIRIDNPERVSFVTGKNIVCLKTFEKDILRMKRQVR
jgi:hypothetical protein